MYKMHLRRITLKRRQLGGYCNAPGRIYHALNDRGDTNMERKRTERFPDDIPLDLVVDWPSGE